MKKKRTSIPNEISGPHDFNEYSEVGDCEYLSPLHELWKPSGKGVCIEFKTRLSGAMLVSISLKRKNKLAGHLTLHLEPSALRHLGKVFRRAAKYSRFMILRDSDDVRLVEAYRMKELIENRNSGS
jgi:hypothetical protein